MSQTIRFTLTRAALVKLRDTECCKFKFQEQEYEIVLAPDTDQYDVAGIMNEDMVYDYDTGENIEEQDEEEALQEQEDLNDLKTDEPGPEFYPHPDKKDYS